MLRWHLLVCSLLVASTCMTLYGFVDNLTTVYDWILVGEFCYTIPKGKSGEINFVAQLHPSHSHLEQTDVVLLKDDDLAKILSSGYHNRITHNRWLLDRETGGGGAISAAEPTVLPTGTSFVPHDRTEGDIVIRDHPGEIRNTTYTICRAIQDIARIKQTLSNSLEVQQISLSVQSHVTGSPLYALILNCFFSPHVKYKISFTNPGGLGIRHWSCRDLGLIELFTLYFLISLAFLVPLRILRSLLLRDIENTRNILICTLGITLISVAVLTQLVFTGLYTMHFFVYAHDGEGLQLFALIGDWAYFAFTVATLYTILRIEKKNGAISTSSSSEYSPQSIVSPHYDRCMTLFAYIGVVFYLLSALIPPQPHESLNPFFRLIYWRTYGTGSGIILSLCAVIYLSLRFYIGS